MNGFEGISKHLKVNPLEGVKREYLYCNEEKKFFHVNWEYSKDHGCPYFAPMHTCVHV